MYLQTLKAEAAAGAGYQWHKNPALVWIYELITGKKVTVVEELQCCDLA
ncbi:hypothetical protein DEDE109153_16440 [Deinococcus deserti]|nr:hypothetical protein [Deinococcus deserti]